MCKYHIARCELWDIPIFHHFVLIYIQQPGRHYRSPLSLLRTMIPNDIRQSTSESQIVNYAVLAATGLSLRITCDGDRFLTNLLALLWYDYALMLPAEIQRVWRRPFTGATAVYLAVRYTLLLQTLFRVFPNWTRGFETQVRCTD